MGLELGLKFRISTNLCFWFLGIREESQGAVIADKLFNLSKPPFPQL